MKGENSQDSFGSSGYQGNEGSNWRRNSDSYRSPGGSSWRGGGSDSWGRSGMGNRGGTGSSGMGSNWDSNWDGRPDPWQSDSKYAAAALIPLSLVYRNRQDLKIIGKVHLWVLDGQLFSSDSSFL